MPVSQKQDPSHLLDNVRRKIAQRQPWSQRRPYSLLYPVPEIDLDMPQSAVVDTECMTKGLHPMLWTAESSRLVTVLPRRVGLEGQESAIDFSAQWPAALAFSGG